MKIEVQPATSRKSSSYHVLITRLISCVILLFNFFCTIAIMNYFHITKLNYRQGDRPRTEKQKVIFFGKWLQKSGAVRLCQWQTLFGKYVLTWSWERLLWNNRGRFYKVMNSLGLCFDYGWCTIETGKVKQLIFPRFFMPWWITLVPYFALMPMTFAPFFEPDQHKQ